MLTRVWSAAIVLVSLNGNVAALETELDGNWVLFVGEDEQSYESIASIRQISSTTIKDENAVLDVAPVLSFRCTPGSPDITMRIDWKRFISSFNTEVGFKVDDGKRQWIKWGVDQTERITHSRSGGDTHALIDQFSTGTSLEVEVTPYSSSPVTATFSLTGIDAALADLAASCEGP